MIRPVSAVSCASGHSSSTTGITSSSLAPPQPIRPIHRPIAGPQAPGAVPQALVPPGLSPFAYSPNALNLQLISRYYREFEELGKLGSGGFGSVYRVKNRLDGSEYAIKKIRFEIKSPPASNPAGELTARALPGGLSTSALATFSLLNDPQSSEFFLKEARTMAKVCRHRHLVRYYQAWLEIDAPSLLPIIDLPSVAIDDDALGFVSEDDTLGYEISSDALRSRASAAQVAADSQALDASYRRPSDDLEISDTVESFDGPDPRATSLGSWDSSDGSLAVVSRSGFSYHSNRLSIKPSMLLNDYSTSGSSAIRVVERKRRSTDVILYIQMQLCNHSTLRDWLSRKDRTASINDSYSLFRQILKGVEHLHRKQYAHFDLKPSNIFLKQRENKTTVKIGDLGLARQLQPDQEESDNNKHGSVLYMSPERHLASASHHSVPSTVLNEKADIFALGIILFELHCIFPTENERITVLTTLGKQGQLPSWFEAQFPDQSALIRQMLAPESNSRPTAKELLESPILRKNSTH